MFEQAVEKIRSQQGKERSAVWMVGEQLIDICRHEPKSAELVAQDLKNPALSLVNAGKKIKAYADSHKTGNFACVTPTEADKVLREFFGLRMPDYDEDISNRSFAETATEVNLEDFFLGN